jgi:hypothetical protein
MDGDAKPGGLGNHWGARLVADQGGDFGPAGTGLEVFG